MTDPLDIEIFGYCDKDRTAIEHLFRTQGPETLLSLIGEYVIAITATGTPRQVWLISSAEGYVQYFHSHAHGRFAHGPTVLDTFAQSTLEWRYDFTALSDLALLESPLGDGTLHPDIKRLGPREVLHFDGTIVRVTSVPFERLHATEYTTVEDTVRVFNEAVLRCVGPENVLPISAGFDSRAILASCMAQGIRPNLLVCGFENSTDVLAAQRLATLAGLPLERIELNALDYLTNGGQISRLTSGAKSASHWHTFHYAHKCTQNRSAHLLIGTNGEWVRTHSLPLGFIARLCDELPPSVFHPVYWRAKMSNPFGRFADWLTPAFQSELTNSTERVTRLQSYCPGSVLDGLDRYYLEQRVRNFHSSGYKMYSANFPNARMPLMDRQWIAATRHLPRQLRLGSNWHRLAIHTNAPKLLQVPVGAIPGAVPAKAPPFEWVSKGIASPVAYTRYSQWFGSSEVRDFIVDNADALEPMLSPEAVKRDVLQGKKKTPIGLLLAFIFFEQERRKVASTREHLPK